MKIFKRVSAFAVSAVTAMSASAALPVHAAATPDVVDYYETENNCTKKH